MEHKKKMSLYDILGVSKDASMAEIKKAYLERMAKIDSAVDSAKDAASKNQAIKLSELLNQAYNVLSDETLRKQYDETLEKEQTVENEKNDTNNNNEHFSLAHYSTGKVSNTKKNEENSNDDEEKITTMSTMLNRKPVQNQDVVVDFDPAMFNLDGDPIIFDADDLGILNNDDFDNIRVTDVEDTPTSRRTARRAKLTFKQGMSIALAVATILASLGIGYVIGNKKNKNDIGTTMSASDTPGTNGEDGKDLDYEEKESDNKVTSVNNVPQIVDPIINFGDGRDPKVVDQKVDELYDLVNTLGIIDPQTHEGYTKEDLRNIILFNNGALMPETEDFAYTMVNRQLDFTAQILSTPRVINYIMYMSGNEMIPVEMIEEDIKNGTDLTLIDTTLLGDSYGYPYLRYLENSYNDLLRTTNKDEFIKKYEKVVRSLGELVYGTGYEMDGKNFKIADFSAIGDVNDGNILKIYANSLSILNVKGVDQWVTVKGQDGGDVTVSIEEIFSNFDLICPDETQLYVDDEGRIVGNEENFHQRLQVNTINAAVENWYHGNLNAYGDTYNKSLKR